MIGMVGRVDKVTEVPFNILPKNYFINAEQIYLVHVLCQNALENSSYEASQIAWILGATNSQCPKLDLQNEKHLWHSVQNLIHTFKPTLCFPVGHGGVLGAVVTCALNSNAQLSLAPETWNTSAKNLFAEGNMGFVLGISTQDDIKKIEQLLSQDKNSIGQILCNVIGTLKQSQTKVTKPLFDLEKMREAYYHSLKRFY